MVKFDALLGQLKESEVADAINNGTTTIAPSQNAVYDALALKADTTALAGKFTQRTITGTTNQITVTNGDGVSGNPTLSLPQNIHTGASPTFAGLYVNASNARVEQRSSATNQYAESLTKQYFTNASFGANAGVNFGVTVTDTGASDTKFVVDRITNAGAYSTNLFAIQASTKEAKFYGNLIPNADSANNLGISSLYWSNLYADRHYFNATADISGATAGKLLITGMPELATTGEGIVMKSPDGTRYKVTVANGGTIAVAAA